MATLEDSSPFRCSICFNSKEGRTPRGLSCFHSFCEECLKAWHEKSNKEGQCARTKVECPICRKKSELPSGDVSSLPIDVNVQQFADYINNGIKSSVCKLCRARKGNSLCLNCSVFLCEECGTKHNLSPMFKSHILSRNICEVHGAVFQCLCTSCVCGVCLQCVHEDLHKNHSLVDTVSGINDIKSKVEKFTGELQELVTKGGLEIAEKRKYIRKVLRIEEKKQTLDFIKREIERLEKEISDQEKLFEAKLATVFEEYEAYSKQASAAILNVNHLLEEDEAGILARLRSAHVFNKEIYSLLKNSLSLIPDFKYVALKNSVVADLTTALALLSSCNVEFGIPDLARMSSISKPPIKILERYCGDKYDRSLMCLCGTPEGDVIVSDHCGGGVYKLYKDNTTAGLHSNGVSACVHGDDVYVISTDGGTVTQIKWDGSKVNHRIRPVVSRPRGIAVSDDHVFILSENGTTKRSFSNADCNETFGINDRRENRPLDRGWSRMSNGHTMGVNFNSNSITEYDTKGNRVKNILTEKNGMDGPTDVAYSYPYIWVAATSHKDDRRKTIKLFKFSD